MAEAGRNDLNWVEAPEYVLNHSSGNYGVATTPEKK